MGHRFPATAAAMAVGVLALATAAHARPAWVSGVSEESSVLSCASVMAGDPLQVIGAAAFAEMLIDRRRLPRVDQTFYVRTLVGAVGDPCVDQQSVSVGLILPRGVRLALTRRRFIRCYLRDIETEQTIRFLRRDGCPRAPTRGTYAVALNRTGPQGPNWKLPLGQALEIDVPVRSSRRKRGPAVGPLGCARTRGQPPCPRSRAGNRVQFAVRVFDGNANPYLVPHVGLLVRRPK